MKILKLLGVIGVMAVLSACTTDIQRIRTTEPSDGTAFTQSLTKEYRDLAAFQSDEMYDWRDAGWYARRGLASARGELVTPQDPAERDLPLDTLPQINDTRARLLKALDGGARDAKPAIAARAQARFDCWLEEQEENFQSDHITACRDDLMAALNELEAKPAAPVAAVTPMTYVVLFDFDKSNINANAAAVIQRVVADYKTNKATAISVTGHTDRAGTEAYNLKLSERRADAVRKALVDAGVPAEAITTAWKGESEPAVPTADGVREQANRRAEIIIQ